MISRLYNSPVGTLLIVVDGGELKMVDWTQSSKHHLNLRRLSTANPTSLAGDEDLMEEVIEQLDEYFAGKRKIFGFSLSPVSTEFERKVWKAINAIGYGERISYCELANVIGMPQAVRAVASAVGRNPISIIVPCHRIVGAGNNLGGYAGGLDAKTRLLALEEIYL